MKLLTKDFSQAEWTAIVSEYDDLSLMQTWEYAEAKAASGPWRVARSVLLHGDTPVGAVQALVRTVPLLNRGLVWVNQGPLWKRSGNSDPRVVPTMMAELRRYWVDERRMYLRVAPPVHAGELDVHEVESAGFTVAEGARGWRSSRLDLSLPVEQLRAMLKQKWRRDLNVAERNGVTCEVGDSPELFESFLAHYDSFLEERGFVTTVTPVLLRAIQSLLPDDKKMLVFEGRLGAEPLGGLLIAFYGSSGLALAGSNPTAKGRSVQSGNLVWWRAILELKKLGYRWLDTGGTDPELTPPGILRFKTRMGASEFELIGEFEGSGGSLFERAVRWQIQRKRGRR